MKNAIFKLFKVTFPFALAFMMCLPFSMTLNAASVKNIPVKKTLFADITGDGKRQTHHKCKRKWESNFK